MVGNSQRTNKNDKKEKYMFLKRQGTKNKATDDDLWSEHTQYTHTHHGHTQTYTYHIYTHTPMDKHKHTQHTTMPLKLE